MKKSISNPLGNRFPVAKKAPLWLAIAALNVIPNPVVAGAADLFKEDYQEKHEGRFKQVCSASIPATTPTQQFIDHKDGTVTDSRTGLMWMRCSLGHAWDGNTCSGKYVRLTWQEALQATRKHNSEAGGFAGHKDWRVPNIKELNTIVELACNAPAVNLELFPGTSNWYYWSSTPSVGVTAKEWNKQRQWGIDFHNGNHMPGNFSQRRVRLVRDGR